MSVWVSSEVVQHLTGLSERTVRSRGQRGELCWRWSQAGAASPGRRSREYRVADLPAAAQEIYWREAVQAGSTEQLAAIPARHLQPSLFTAPPPVAERERLALSKEDAAEAQRRLETIGPLLDFSKRPPGARFTVCTGESFTSIEKLEQFLSALHHIGARTLRRWRCRYAEKGFIGLADGRGARRDSGQSKFFRQFPLAADYIKNKYLNERLSVQLAWEALRRDWGTDALPYNHGAQPPSYSTVREFLGHLPKPLLTLAREGERAFHNKTAPYLLPDYTCRAPMELWVSDHCWHDVFVRNDGYFRGIPEQQPMRLWLTAIADWRSRKLLGYVWALNPSSYTIASALRQAIERHGIPQAILIDNGRDYQKIAHADEITQGVLHRLGIQAEFCKPYHPQSKNIESFFRTLHQRFDTRWRPFYAGTDSKHRPEECDEMLALHDRWVKGEEETSLLPTAADFIEAARYWLEEEYNATHAHRGRAMNGRSPNQVFEQGVPQNVKRLPEGAPLDALFCADPQSRVLSEGACIELDGERYQPADLQSTLTLHPRIGERVQVLCDPGDIGKAIALDAAGFFLGHLRAQKLVARGPVSREDVSNMERMRRRLLNAYKGYRQNLADRRRQAGDLSELSHLRRNAGLSATPALPAQVLPHPDDPTIPDVAAVEDDRKVGYRDFAQHFFDEEK